MATAVGVLFQNPIVKPLSSNATFMSGCTATFYLTGTTTLTPVYADGALTTPLANPLTADFSGTFVAVYLDPAIVYRVIIKTSAGVLVSDTDPVIPSAISGITSTIVGRVLYPVTAAELSLSVTPTNFAYPADPYVDPRRYGADPLGVTDSTTAVQTAINVAYASKGMVWIGPSCTFLCGALSLTMTGSGTKPLRIVGSSVIGSTLLAKPGLSATALLTFTSSAPATVLIESFLLLEHFSILNNGAITTGVHGLSLQGLASVQVSDVRISGFDRNFDLVNLELATFDRGFQSISCNTGMSFTLVGTVNTNTAIRIENGRVNSCAKRAIDFDGGTSLSIRGLDFEQNGTAGDVTTGGIFVRSNVSPDLQEAHTLIEGCSWGEFNKGWTINIAAPLAGQSRVTIRSMELIAAESGREIFVGGASFLLLEDLESDSAADTYNITATSATLTNVSVQNLIDSGVGTPIYNNVRVGGVLRPWGRQDSATLTLTGVTGTPTCTGFFFQQGSEVRLTLSTDLLGASTSTACTVTGIPAKYQLSGTVGNIFLPAIVEDNTADSAQSVLLSNASGAITLLKNGSTTGFTAAGNKGLRRQSWVYSLAI